MLFFEKRNQKTFARLVPRELTLRQVTKAQEQKFFASFLQKRRLF
jgi:hypothetical protein